MKLIINHFLDPRIILTPNVGSDKSWVWVAFDFSEGKLEETTFALRFASAEIAQEFKKEFTKGQEEMSRLMAGLDSTEGKAEADEATKALEGLDIKKGTSESTESAAAAGEVAPKASEEGEGK